jgi:hypothetical protein
MPIYHFGVDGEAQIEQLDDPEKIALVLPHCTNSAGRPSIVKLGFYKKELAEMTLMLLGDMSLARPPAPTPE